MEKEGKINLQIDENFIQIKCPDCKCVYRFPTFDFLSALNSKVGGISWGKTDDK